MKTVTVAGLRQIVQEMVLKETADVYHKLNQFIAGDRVEISPRYDAWMQGDKYGEVTRALRVSGVYFVKLDKTGRTGKLPAEDLKLVSHSPGTITDPSN